MDSQANLDNPGHTRQNESQNIDEVAIHLMLSVKGRGPFPCLLSYPLCLLQRQRARKRIESAPNPG